MESERTIDGFKAMGHDELIEEILDLRKALRTANADLARINQLAKDIQRGKLSVEDGLELIRDVAA